MPLVKVVARVRGGMTGALGDNVLRSRPQLVGWLWRGTLGRRATKPIPGAVDSIAERIDASAYRVSSKSAHTASGSAG